METNLPQKHRSEIISQVLQPQYLATVNPASIEECVLSPSPCLAIIKQESEVKLQAAITLQVNNLVDFINVGKTMGQNQVVETVKMIIDEFKFLKIEDIAMCFKEIKLGKHGQFFDRMDGAFILSCLSDYTSRRSDIAEKININKHAKQKNLAIFNENIRESFKQLAKELREIDRPFERKVVNVKHNPVIQKILKQWEARCKFGQSFVDCAGTKMNQSEFLKHKLKRIERYL